jgi:hypothetical protein
MILKKVKSYSMARQKKDNRNGEVLIRSDKPSLSNSVARYMNVLRLHLPEIRERYKVKSLAVFGSFVRNDQEMSSDLDVLVEFSKTPSLFEFVEIELYLSDLLGVKVDLVMKDGLKARIGRHILGEAVPV